ncbi:MAG: nucleotidyl transferase AbiEii/AbiGii toxin family protein [Kineosporiaceae bacterium]
MTAIQRGVTNTRWRDFADIYLLSRGRTVSGSSLQEALRVVGEHRGAPVVPLHERLSGYPAPAQTKWGAWRREVGDRVWDPRTESWEGPGPNG